MSRLAKDMLVYGGGDLLFRLAAFAALPLYTRLLSVEEFGVMALVSTGVGLTGILINCGLNNSLQRFYLDKQTQQADKSVMVTTGLLVVVAQAIVALLILLPVCYLLQTSFALRYGFDWSTCLVALLTILPDQVVQYVLVTLRLHFKPWKYVTVSFLKNLAGILVGLFLMYSLQQGVLGYFNGLLIASAVAAPVALFLARSDLVFCFDYATARQMLRFGYPFIFMGLAFWALSSMDRWMLAEMSDSFQVGLIGVAFTFATVLMFVRAAFSQAWAPIALTMYRDEPDYKSKYATVFDGWFFSLVLLSVVMAIFSRELLMLCTPESYWPAAPVTGLVIMGVAISGTAQVTALGIYLEKNTRLLAAGAWLAACLNFVVNLLLIPHLGALGSALATFLSYLAMTLFYFFYSQKIHRIPVDYRKIFLCMILLFFGIVSCLLDARIAWSSEILLLKTGLVLLTVFSLKKLGCFSFINVPYMK